MKPIFTFILLLVFSISIQASHLLGGEMYYEKLSGNDYKIVLKLYRDITGITLGNSQSVIETSQSSPDVNHSLGLTSTQIVSASCSKSIEVLTYEKTITKTTIPSGGLVFYWSTCCRPNGITNLSNSASQGFYIETKMFPIPGTTAAGNGARFTTLPTFGINSSANTQLNNQAIDPDLGDSVTINFAYLKQNATGTNIVFDSAYTVTQPFDTNTVTAMDTSSGMITVVNPSIGQYSYGIVARSYINGNLNSVSRRDVSVSINSYNVNHPAVAVNNISVSGGSYTSSGNTYNFIINEGGSIDFDLDAAYLNGSLDTMVIQGSGNAMQTSSGGLCSGNNCASFSTSTGSFWGSGSITGQFSFSPDTSFVSGNNPRNESFLLSVLYQDSCGVYHYKYTNVNVSVIPMSIWTNISSYEVCQGGSAQAFISGDTTNLVWSPSIGVSDSTSASPILSPATTTTYTVTNLNDNSTLTITYTVNQSIAPFALSHFQIAAYIPSTVPHTSSLWIYNGTPVAMNTDTILLNLAGKYVVFVENGACSQFSDTLNVTVGNQAQSSNLNGTTTHSDSISSFDFGLIYNLGENILNKINFVIPEPGVFKTSNISQVEIYDYSVSTTTPVYSTIAAKVNDFIWSTQPMTFNIMGGKVYQIVVTGNYSEMPLFTPSSFPYTDNNNFLTFTSATVYTASNQSINAAIPYMTFEFASSIGLDESDLDLSHVFPNPFNDVIEVKAQGQNVIELTDNFGRILITKEFSDQAQIETSDLPNGAYMYRINGDAGASSGKLIK